MFPSTSLFLNSQKVKYQVSIQRTQGYRVVVPSEYVAEDIVLYNW